MPNAPRFTSRTVFACILVAIILLVVGISTLIPSSSALTNNGSITSLGVPLTENFDTLASTGTNITWTDNSTIPGWYSTRATYNSGTGSSNTGALYSFGVAGTNPVADRSLGSVGSGSTGTIYSAVKLTNNTGTTITALDVSYIGEQWRNGGATSPAVSVAQTVDFQYQVANSGVITAANTPTTGWIDHDPLDFTSPTFGTTAAATLDGNAAANRASKSATLAITIASGQEVWLRWRDVDHSGNDHGLAIDDLSVTANGSGTPTPTPTPSSTPTLSIANVTQAETNSGSTTFTFNVTLTSAAGAGGVSFAVNTADGTTNPANAGSDYVAIVGGSGSIPAGGSSTTVNVTVNGDTTPELNETFFVNLTGITGTTNSTSTGTGTITNDDVTVTAIYTIQGSGMSSPLAGSSVTTTGVVTGKRSLGSTNNGFYIQDQFGDANDSTSDGILVFTGSTVPTVNVGDSVQVTGTVTEFESSTTDEPDGIAPADPKTATELTGATTVVLATAVPLPLAVDVTSNNILNPAATSRGAELEKYEFMRLSIGSLTVSQPTNNFGEFWGVETSRPRPFREPGIEAGDPVPAADEPPYAPGQPPTPPIWDGNFERIMVDSGAALTTGSTRRPQVQVTTGTIVTNIVGPLDYAFDAYRIVLDATATPGVSGGVAAASPVPVRAAGEFTIAHANLENFVSSNATKLSKASLAVRNVLRTPDILGLIEVNTLASATALANRINSDAGDPGVNYVAFMSETAGTQDIGYLVNAARVQVVGTPVQYHAGTTFTYCGLTNTLHDRPSFVLTANMPRAGGGTVPVTVILNHTKSLIATDSPRPYGTCGTGTEGARNREKRRLQAEDIADLIQLHSGENLVVLGDLNAFDFNDGLGDVVGTLRGTPALPEQVVEPSTDRWTYDLTNLLYSVTPDQQYSLLFEGNAQALDHVLVNSPMLARKTNFVYAHYNADFSELFAANAAVPEGVADHDAPVAYFSFPGDPDGDGVEDPGDNCPNVANANQANYDGDAEGDVCDADDDNDGDPDTTDCAPFNSAVGHTVVEVCDGIDNNCDGVIDEGFVNSDGDGQADCVDLDDDNDGDPDTTDCSPLNSAISHNAVEVCDGIDNDCDGAIDEGFANSDNDSQADCVDPDDDNDGVLDGADNCPFTANSDQTDTDGDGFGNGCDFDDDGDGVLDSIDNCPLVANPNQEDIDGDGIGDVCDAAIGPATNKDQCKNGGWQLFNVPRTFKNQGDCIQYVNTGK